MQNRLARESSPYLRQHAGNPVDWYPWGAEALEQARRQNRPILLSIGYSACHWCHVMAHESFEDPATAEVMNAHFINIKVDREERPDLDRIYQSAHQILMHRGGGWPLTLFLTPDQVPFFGGTYFPPAPRHGLPAFRDLLERVAAFHREQPEQLAEQNSALRAALARQVPQGGAARLDGRPLAEARGQLAAAFDRRYGGFGAAPKFPHASDLTLLLHLGCAGDGEALGMAIDTLRAMADGGLYDQLGGGFYRYSVDERWEIPHFEKMLYDNALLLGLYADAYALTREPRLREVAEGVADFVLRELEAPEGGYYASLDADSEQAEGRFYLWSPEAARGVLDEQHYQAAALHYGLDRPPNFEGQWHLRVARPLPAVAERLGLPVTATAALIAAARARLFAARAGRVAPGRDEKRLTAWNGLMIRAMAGAGVRLGRPDLIDSAERAVAFIRRELFREGRLLAVGKDGGAQLPAYLDDYAFLLDGLLALTSARWRDGHLAFAVALADLLLEQFEDESHGGFFFTADDHEPLIQRPKPFADESLPSGNGVACAALARLARLTGDLNYHAAAERTLLAASPILAEIPYAHGALLIALHEALAEPETVVLRGSAAALAPWRERLGAHFAPHRFSLAVPDDARDLPGLLAERRPPAEGVLAWRCVGERCEPPAAPPERLWGTGG